MTFFQKHIIDCFFQRYANSTAAPGKRTCISALKLYPEFDSASLYKKKSFLKAAEILEKRGIVKLSWYKNRAHKTLKTLECVDMEAMFRLADKPFPKKVMENIKEVIPSITAPADARRCKELLLFMSENVTPNDVERGIDKQAFKDFAKLLKTLHDNESFTAHKPLPCTRTPYSVLDGITPRALSVMLYNDSKRLEQITKLLSRLLKRAEKEGLYVPNLAFLARSFPETLISGKIVIYFDQSKTPLVNDTGNIIGFPLETIKQIESISAIKKEQPTVLTIENKETFYALTNSKKYTCLLYTGGYPSRAVSALLRVLSKSGFSFFHAGDVDPDGILILQDLIKNAKKNITPVCMDATTFFKYRKHGRKLAKTMLDNIRLIGDEIRSIDGIQEVLSLIESTGIGIEQELIDYGYA
ncbi:MAG: DUF2220 family protein [Spirochaetaceae bacterium]|jgi:hypothetical protein|nr:DUF2220 family protein [Spirochaetaceae bacterium]